MKSAAGEVGKIYEVVLRTGMILPAALEVLECHDSTTNRGPPRHGRRGQRIGPREGHEHPRWKQSKVPGPTSCGCSRPVGHMKQVTAAKVVLLLERKVLDKWRTSSGGSVPRRLFAYPLVRSPCSRADHYCDAYDPLNRYQDATLCPSIVLCTHDVTTSATKMIRSSLTNHGAKSSEQYRARACHP